MKALGVFLIAAAFDAAVLAGSAHAATFTFSFSNVDGPVSGSVSGTIVLPDGDGTGLMASSVLIDSYPAALNLGPAPVDALAGGYDANSFTVTAGAITSADFVGLIDDATALFLNAGLTGLDLEGCACDASDGVLDTNSSTLAFASAATPLPATLPLFASGLGVLGLLGWRRKRKAAVLAA